MRDFRRWRDWYLAAQKKPGVQLDGSPRHPKKDVNGNLRWDVDGDPRTSSRGATSTATVRSAARPPTRCPA
jgi:hypothetical protein